MYELIKPIIATRNANGEPLTVAAVVGDICKKTGQRPGSLKRNVFIKKAIEETIEFLAEEQQEAKTKRLSHEDLALMSHPFDTENH